MKFICTEHPDYVKVINSNNIMEDGSEDWRHYAGGIYLHGKLEDINGYDCVDLIDFEGFETFKQTDDAGKTITRTKFPEGEFDCEVYGYDKPCKVFIWSIKMGNYLMFKGLIVDPENIKYYNDAKVKFNNKKRWI